MKDDWIEAAVATPETGVPDTVVTTIKEQLKGVARERALRPAELSAVARKLLEAMEPSGGGKSAP